MLNIVDEQMREVTRSRMLRVAARQFVRLEFDQADLNVMAAQAGIEKGTFDLPPGLLFAISLEWRPTHYDVGAYMQGAVL